jgi:FkbM family methyltransferase
MKIDYLQVGSHVGNTDNDNVFTNITDGMNVILIEPIPDLFGKLVHNYKEKSTKNNIEFLNLAVSTYDGTLDLYSYKPPALPKKKFIWSTPPKPHILEWGNQLASVNMNHIEAHGLPNSTFKTTVSCQTLNSIIRERNITSIENLHTDTEGHDCDILMALDLDLVRPTTIVFESLHADRTFVRGDKYIQLLTKFKSNGYNLIYEDYFDTCISLNA